LLLEVCTLLSAILVNAVSVCVSDEGVWDPDRWFASVSPSLVETNAREKRKQPVDVELDTGLRKRPSGL